jgi:hypothetical protein
MTLGIRGNAVKSDDVLRILKSLGGVDSGEWNGTEEYNIYYINPITKLIDAHSLIVFDNDDVDKLKKFCRMTVEDFDSQFPYKVGQTVSVIRPDGIGNETPAYGNIVDMRWDSNTDSVLYDVSFNKSDHGLYEVDEINKVNVSIDTKLATHGYIFNNKTSEALTVHPEKELEIQYNPEEYDAIIRNGKIIIVKKI